MKKTQILFTSIGLSVATIVTGIAVWHFVPKAPQPGNYQFPAGKYGDFLAAQHAIHINDFDAAIRFSDTLSDRNLPPVRNTIIMSNFLAGKLPADQVIKDGEIGANIQLVYDAYLIRKDDWAGVYAKHKKDESALAAPLRIWSGVASGRVAETLKFIDGLKTNESWKSFVRGQVYAETDKIKDAADQFAKVSIDFMNVADYMYIFAFYNENGMLDSAIKLRESFAARPGGMFMLDSKKMPQWADYKGYGNQLTFSIIQSVSHTQVILYSDLSLLLLRFAQIVQGDPNGQDDALNYYLGQYFFNNGGDYKKLFDKIDPISPYYPFAAMKIAEKTGKIQDLERVVKTNPLFVPAINKLVAKNIQQDNEKDAIGILDRALKNDNLGDIGRAFFLKTRAQVYLTFDNADNAQKDIRAAADILPMDSGILAIQSRIWSAQRRELDTAYDYAMALVRKNPSDVEAWDVLAMAIWAREGATPALDILERVGQVSSTCSVLFEHLGDLYATAGKTKQAIDAYNRAIDLSEDGMTIMSKLQKKIKALK